MGVLEKSAGVLLRSVMLTSLRLILQMGESLESKADFFVHSLTGGFVYIAQCAAKWGLGVEKAQA